MEKETKQLCFDQYSLALCVLIRIFFVNNNIMVYSGVNVYLVGTSVEGASHTHSRFSRLAKPIQIMGIYPYGGRYLHFYPIYYLNHRQY